MTNEQLKRLADLHRSLRFEMAIADALMPKPGEDPHEIVDHAAVTRWGEAVAKADAAYETLRKYPCGIGWPSC